MSEKFNAIRSFYFVFILFVNNGYSIDFSLYNIPKNLYAIAGIASYFFAPSTGASLEERDEQFRIDPYADKNIREDIWSIKNKLGGITGLAETATGLAFAGLFLVVVGFTCYHSKVERLEGRINELETGRKDKKSII